MPLKSPFMYLVILIIRASLVAQLVKNLLAMQETACIVGDPHSIPGSGRSPEEGNSNQLQDSLPGKSHGQRILAGYSSGHKELDTTEAT